MAKSRPLRVACLVVATVVLAACASACADAGPEGRPMFTFGSAADPSAHVWPEPQRGISWARVVAATALVTGLICLGVFALKKLNGGLPLSKGRYLEVLESRPVGRNVQVFLIRVAGRVVLLASCGQSITQVAEFSEDELQQPDAAKPAAIENFSALLRKLTGAHE